jgi:hypothetical protein
MQTLIERKSIMKKKIIVMGCLLTILASCFSVFAQDPTEVKGKAGAKARIQSKMEMDRAHAEHDMVFQVAGMADSGTFTFIAADNMFGGHLVKGAPYSAQAVTENIQTLSDGNRIVRKNTAAIYRDSEGRTRHDQTLGSIGQYAVQGDPPKTFFINDPVAGVHFVLEPNSKIARKMMIPTHDGPVFERKIAPSAGAQETTVYMREKRPTAAPRIVEATPPQIIREDISKEGDQVFITSTHSAPVALRAEGKPVNVKTEPLGTQNIEGVSAEGSRTTLTIPAGEIGNEQPINVVTETWFSPELKVLILRKHSDPRQGEMIYRLTNINRAEPDRSLFEVPADYTVKESVSPGMKMKLEAELVREKMKPREKNDQ